MSQMQSAYFIIGGFALVALFIRMEWLFFLLLLAFGALLAADSLSRPHGTHSHGHGGHAAAPKHSEGHPVKRAPPASFLDVLLANLIAGKHHRDQVAHEKHTEHEKHEEHKADGGGHGEKGEKEDKDGHGGNTHGAPAPGQHAAHPPAQAGHGNAPAHGHGNQHAPRHGGGHH